MLMLLKSARLMQKLTGLVLGSAGAAIAAGNVLLCAALLVFGPDVVISTFTEQV